MRDKLHFEPTSEVGNPIISFNGVVLEGFRVVKYNVQYGMIYDFAYAEPVYCPREDRCEVQLQGPGGTMFTLVGAFDITGRIDG